MAGPDDNGNILLAKEWLRKVLIEQWDKTRELYENHLSNEQKEKFCHISKIEDVVFVRNDRHGVDNALAMLMDSRKENKLRDKLINFFKEV